MKIEYEGKIGKGRAVANSMIVRVPTPTPTHPEGVFTAEVAEDAEGGDGNG